MNEPRSACPDCSGELRPIKLIDATEPMWHSEGGRHVELRYAAEDAEPSLFMGTIQALGVVRGSICPSCGRILLHGRPL
jgi:hypothetical protein